MFFFFFCRSLQLRQCFCWSRELSCLFSYVIKQQHAGRALGLDDCKAVWPFVKYQAVSPALSSPVDGLFSQTSYLKILSFFHLFYICINVLVCTVGIAVQLWPRVKYLDIFLTAVRFGRDIHYPHRMDLNYFGYFLNLQSVPPIYI